jgi:hypothetical protein
MVQPIHPIPSSLYRLIETPEEKHIRMLKQEIHYRMGNPIAAAWWKFMPGIIIVVPWPTITVHISGSTCVMLANPNDDCRSELELLVGKQGWDWDWRTGPEKDNTLIIKVRRAHASWATMAALKWG